jgi:Flp pilus assembly protein CpaB
MSYSHPGANFRTWHVFVFLGVVIVAVEISSIRMMGRNTNQFTYSTVPARPATAPPVPAPAPVPAETVEVLVATRDLPVGTVFVTDQNLWVAKKVAKDNVPPGVVTHAAELIDKRLSRPVRAGEALLATDLSRGFHLPEGTDLVSLTVNPATEPFLVPGSRVDVMASIRLGNTFKVFDLLVNVLVINVNHGVTDTKNGVYPDVNEVGFALTKKQAAALELARARGCNLTLKLRNSNRTAEDDAKYDIDELIKMLENEPTPPSLKLTLDELLAEVAPPPRPVTEDR